MSALSLWRELEAGGWAALERWATEKREEDLHVDFKAAKWVGNDIASDDVANFAKGLSAFANIEGGVLLFGIRTNREGRGSPDRVAGLEGVADVDRYKNRLDDLRSSVTVPEVPGVRMQTIRDPADPTRGVVAVLIPYNDLGPFRASKGAHANIYFQRSSTTSEPMPHQVLSAMFARVPVPDLRLGIRADVNGGFQLILKNVGRGHASHVCAYVDAVPRMRQFGQQWTVKASDDGRATATLDLVLHPEEINWLGILNLPATPNDCFEIDATVYAAGGAPLRVSAVVQRGDLPVGHTTWLTSQLHKEE